MPIYNVKYSDKLVAHSLKFNRLNMKLFYESACIHTFEKQDWFKKLQFFEQDKIVIKTAV